MPGEASKGVGPARFAAEAEVEAAVETAMGRANAGAGEEDVGDRRVAEEDRTVAGGENGIIGARRARPFRVGASRCDEEEAVEGVEEVEAPLRLLRADDCRESSVALGADVVEGEDESEVKFEAGAELDGDCLNACESGSCTGKECLGWLPWAVSRPVGAPVAAGEALELGIGVVVLLVFDVAIGKLGDAGAVPLDVLAVELSPAEKPEMGFCIPGGRPATPGRFGWPLWVVCRWGERTSSGRR